MLVTLYKSSLCPRCHFAKKYLLEIAADDFDIHIEEIDILKEPKRAWNDGIRMIPALKIDDHISSSLFLTKKDILHFINQHLAGAY